MEMLADPGHPEPIRIEGQLLDGDGAAIDDAMLEIWHADAHGHYPEYFRQNPDGPTFRGFGRAATDREGRFLFRTIMPGPVPAADGTVIFNAPHINVSIFARGLLKRLVTRIYFPGHPLNASDPALNAAPPDRRRTLIARRVEGGSGTIFRFDVILQGANETVFFDI
jgi:protocatechuate 3,4-dioxygenase alpha subunit